MVTMAAQRGFELPYLRAYRRKRVMTQRELVAASGVSITTIVRAESAGGSVSVGNIRKLAMALGITAEELMRANPEEASSSSDSG